MAKLAIYPGSFDPITNGHLNIIERSLKIFDSLYIAVAVNASKQAMFSPEERVEMIREALDHEIEGSERIKVEFFSGLIVDYALKCGADALVRGLRAVSDFEYEFQMASMNRKLSPKVETMFMMTAEGQFYISSRTVKEVASLGGCVDGLVPTNVKRELRRRFGRKNG